MKTVMARDSSMPLRPVAMIFAWASLGCFTGATCARSSAGMSSAQESGLDLFKERPICPARLPLL